MNILNQGHFNIDLERELNIERPLVEHERMSALIALEQARANRGGGPICVVTFSPRASWEAGEVDLSPLTRLLGQRVRRVDTPGWLQGRVVVLLTATTPLGAHAFSETIIQGLPPGLDIDFMIHAYPEINADEEAAYRSTPITRMQPRDEGQTPQALPVTDEAIHEHPHSIATTAISSLLSHPERRGKRLLDLLGATSLLLVTLPLLLMAGLIVQIRDRGPVFCLQQRLGYLGKPFIMYKLRTMWQRAPESRHSEYLAKLISTNGTLTKLDQEGDARIIPGMGLFRTLGIDELPQLINVIRGDMSLVGPRPCLPYEAQVFDQWHRERFNVRPGLTGLWQVSGKNRTTFRRMMELDVRYAYQGTLLSDLIILLRTPLAVFKLARANPNSNSSREG